MRIKRDKDTRNEYRAVDGVWVRNFTKDAVAPVNLSPLVSPEDYSLIIGNESHNQELQIANVSDERITFRKAVIVNDGHGFAARQDWLLALPDNVAVLAVNRALAKWRLMGGTPSRAINLYVVNNPYRECMGYLPERYYPACVASSRTCHEFVRRYKGRRFLYQTTPSPAFGINRGAAYYVDDYRNPVCAAINLCFHFGVRRLGLFCCDDSFEDERPGATRLASGLYTYPPHVRNQRVMDANLYWLTHQEEADVKVCNCSSGIDYENATYIKTQDDMVEFFKDPVPVSPGQSVGS